MTQQQITFVFTKVQQIFYDFLIEYDLGIDLFFTKWSEYLENFSLLLIDFNLELDEIVSFQYVESYFFKFILLNTQTFSWEFIADLKVIPEAVES